MKARVTATTAAAHHHSFLTPRLTFTTSTSPPAHPQDATHLSSSRKRCVGFSVVHLYVCAVILGCGRTHICHRYHRLYPWRKICLVEKFHISAKNLNNLLSFIKIYAVFVLNLCGEKSVWRKSLWRKMTNMRCGWRFSSCSTRLSSNLTSREQRNRSKHCARGLGV